MCTIASFHGYCEETKNLCIGFVIGQGKGADCVGMVTPSSGWTEAGAATVVPLADFSFIDLHASVWVGLAVARSRGLIDLCFRRGFYRDWSHAFRDEYRLRRPGPIGPNRSR